MGRIASTGQVTIPKEIREELGLRAGEEITFEETDDGYVRRKDADENRFEKHRGVADTDETVEERMRELRGDRRDETVVDTSALIALLYPDDEHNRRAASLLRAGTEDGALVINSPVYGELSADSHFESRDELDDFFEGTGIVLEELSSRPSSKQGMRFNAISIDEANSCSVRNAGAKRRSLAPYVERRSPLGNTWPRISSSGPTLRPRTRCSRSTRGSSGSTSTSRFARFSSDLVPASLRA